MYRTFLAASLGLLALSTPVPAQGNQLKTDFVFVVDCSGSMDGNITAVRNGVNSFAQQLVASNVDARFALVRFGRALASPAEDGRPELVLDLTSSAVDLSNALANLTTGGTSEPGLEAIRMALGAAPQGFQQAPGSISYRTDALPNIILLTDEDSDGPAYLANRLCAPNGSGGTVCQGNGGSGGPGSSTWPAYLAEINATATALLARGAYLNLVINSTDGQSLFQYGTPFATVLDSSGNFDRLGTFNAMSSLVQQSVQGRVLAGGGLARSFNLNIIASDTDNDGISDLVEDLFRTKVQETLQANAAPVFTQGPVATCGAGSTPLPAVVGQPLTIVVQATGPEAGQTTTLSLQPGAPAGVVLDATAGATANGQIRWTPGPGQIGLQVLRVVATDDGLPQRSSTLEVCINVGAPSVSAYCFGTGCPCANDDATGGCTNSTGAGGLLGATGSTSTTTDDLRLVATRLPLGTFGVLYAGTSATQAPFGDGFRCVQPGPPGSPAGAGFLRFPIQNSGVGGAFQEGPGIAAWSLTAPGGFGAILPGSVWHFQAYYRNPAGPCGQGWNLTNALSVTFQ